jgi:hypothetical protein
VTVARALVLLSAGLLALPGLYVTLKGLATIRRRSAVVQGRTVTGVRALGAGLILVLWGLGMLGFSILVVAAKSRPPR